MYDGGRTHCTWRYEITARHMCSNNIYDCDIYRYPSVSVVAHPLREMDRDRKGDP